MDLRHCIACLTLTIVTATVPSTFADESRAEYVPPDELGSGWYARIETSHGRIVARLLPEQAPQSVAYFVSMAQGTLEWLDRASGELKKGPYYDGIRVHAAHAGKRFEAGDPGGTGNTPADLNVPLELGPVNFNVPGRLGMTRNAGEISAVQFFVTMSGQPWLTGNHPCFGTVISGLEVVTEISQVKTYNNHRPVDPPIIEQIRIFTIGEVEPLAEPQPYRPRFQQFEARPERQRKKYDLESD